MSAVSTAALLAMFPSPDHTEVGVGPYGYDIAPAAMEFQGLPGPGEGLEIMGRRIFDTTEPDITGTGENFRLRLYRDPSGQVRLDQLSYDSLLFAARYRPELGDKLDLSALFGTWEEVWAWDTGRSQYRFFLPITLTALGFSNTDQDEDERLKYYAAAGAGVGGEVLARLIGPIGVQLRAEAKAKSTNRHRGGEINTVRHEVRAAAELGVSYLRDSQAWILGSWAEQITQWEPRDDDGADGVDRQYFAAGLRLSGRFYKEAPYSGGDEDLDLEMLLDALRVRDEVPDEPTEPSAAPEGEDTPEDGAGILEVHWSELQFVERVDPSYPEGATGEGRCTVWVAIDERGQPSDVRAEDCTEPWLKPAMQAAWGWSFQPIEQDGVAVPAAFTYTMIFEDPAGGQ